MRKGFVWILVAAAAAILLLFWLSGYGPRAVHTPFMTALSRIQHLCVKLLVYSETHSTFPDGTTTNFNLDGLVAVGALSADDSAYIRDHHIRYYGFDLKHIGPLIPVFEDVFTNTRSPRVIVGYSDGSARSASMDHLPGP
jgi:hypothetical protein